MKARFKRIQGSLNALMVLESVVRHSSLTRAGQELFLTQPSVSRHISLLEARLGQKLFLRTGNRIQPTAAAEELANAIALGLGHIELGWAEATKPATQHEVSIACSFGFAEGWLMPRFGKLTDAFPDHHLHVTTSDRMESIGLEKFDIVIVWHQNLPRHWIKAPLFEEEVFPICSKDYAAAHPELVENPENLLLHPLLHFDDGQKGFLTWSKWFAEIGIDVQDPPVDMVSNAFPFVKEAAIQGKGIALGWRGIDDRFLEEGLLVQIGPSVNTGKIQYYLCYEERDGENDAVVAIANWIKNQIGPRKV